MVKKSFKNLELENNTPEEKKALFDKMVEDLVLGLAEKRIIAEDLKFLQNLEKFEEMLEKKVDIEYRKLKKVCKSLKRPKGEEEEIEMTEFFKE